VFATLSRKSSPFCSTNRLNARQINGLQLLAQNMLVG
jgi:hypothetical protein